MQHDKDGRNTWWDDWVRWGDRIGWRLNGALDYAGCWGCGVVLLIAAVIFCSGMATQWVFSLYDGK